MAGNGEVEHASEVVVDRSASGSSDSGGELEYSGWVYHLGVNSIGHEYCHLRFLSLRGKYVAMYKRDPHEYHGIGPIRKGVIGPNLMVEELGRRRINDQDFYVLRLYNRLDETKKGEIACATAGEVHKWMEAFDQAKQQVEYDLLRGSSRHKLSIDNETELNLEGHRPRVRRYAHGLRKLIRIGKGPEMLLRQSSNLGRNAGANTYPEGDVADAIQAHEWRCIRTLHGIRIFEDATNSKSSKNTLLKSVGVVDASVDAVFEVLLSLDRHVRYEWDVLTGDLELVDSVNGHYDVVYGTYDLKHQTWWHSKKDFVFSRQWFRGQDGAYTILQFPAVHKKRPPRSGYQRTKISPSIWEISRLNSSESSTKKCVVTQMLEIHSGIWDKWKRNHYSDFEKSIPYSLLCQVAGLREFFSANPSLTLYSSSTTIPSTVFETSNVHSEFEDSEMKDEFYDAMTNDDLLEDEDSDDDDEEDTELPKAGKVKLKNVSWAIASLALKRASDVALTKLTIKIKCDVKTNASVGSSELETNFSAISIDLNQLHGSLRQAKGETDSNCWSSPSGQGFMIRGKTYLKDYSKVVGGDPLLKLVAVDWFKAEDSISKVGLHPNCLIQSEVGRKLPFILAINLQIPAKPNYSLVLYYAAERPVRKESLLGRFIDGTDIFRDSRFKLIPSIIEGYWMVKRAVGTKACLLGKAVTCNYLRKDNFLEIDVDIGSSSVARSIISLVLGYVTSIVVDLAILIEGKEENELPEYILGTVRLNRLQLDTAVPLP